MRRIISLPPADAGFSVSKIRGQVPSSSSAPWSSWPGCSSPPAPAPPDGTTGRHRHGCRASRSVNGEASRIYVHNVSRTDVRTGLGTRTGLALVALQHMP
jgi:hypothetical protein